MELYTRNFLDGLTADEEKEYERILNEETKGAGGFGRKNLYHLYPVTFCKGLFNQIHKILTF